MLMNCVNVPCVVNAHFLCVAPSFPAVQPCSQQLLQLLQFQVGLLVLVTEEEDDLEPLHQLLQTLLCTRLSRLCQVLYSV